MNIEKIKEFNQKILAIFGSLAILLIAILIIWLLSSLFHDFSSRRDSVTEIVSNEKASENYEKNIRTHQVSFEDFKLVDSVNLIYIIPVSQTALELAEYVDKKNKSKDGTMGLLNMYSDFDNFYYDYYSYNNLLIYDSRDASIQKLFETRISINKINLEKIGNKFYILLAATDRDTNKDGILDKNDFKTLYIYGTINKKLIGIESENTDFVNYEIIKGKNVLVIKYGLDKNKNGYYGWDEPMIMKVYNIDKDTLSELIEPELISDLQNTLDGKK